VREVLEGVITRCPVCGGQVQATVGQLVNIEAVIIVESDIAYEGVTVPAILNEWPPDGDRVKLYCESGHPENVILADTLRQADGAPWTGRDARSER
jgi:hypothetical protein